MEGALNLLNNLYLTGERRGQPQASPGTHPHWEFRRSGCESCVPMMYPQLASGVQYKPCDHRNTAFGENGVLQLRLSGLFVFDDLVNYIKIAI